MHITGDGRIIKDHHVPTRIVRFMSSASVQSCGFIVRTRAIERGGTKQDRSKSPTNRSAKADPRTQPSSCTASAYPPYSGQSSRQRRAAEPGPAQCENSLPGEFRVVSPPGPVANAGVCGPSANRAPSGSAHRGAHPGNRARARPWRGRRAGRLCRAGVPDLQGPADWDQGSSGP
jgi:hypothetical protein